MKQTAYLLSVLILSGCGTGFLARNHENISVSTLESLHELRSEVAGLSHLLHGHSVDLQLIEEKISHLSLKKRELLSENLESIQQKVDQIESVLATMRMNVEQTKKQHQLVVDAQLQRLVSLENKVSSHDSSLHIVKDLKTMMGQIKSNIQSYRVESGDTLEGISRKFGLKMHDIKSINRLETDQIQVGQTLKIPL